MQLVHDTDGKLIYAGQHEYDFITGEPNITDWDLILGSNDNSSGDRPGFCDCIIDEVRVSNVIRKDYMAPPVVSNVGIVPGSITTMAASIGTSPLKKVELMYRAGGTGGFTALAMTASSFPDEFTAAKPDVPGTILYYYIRAENEAGQVTTSPADAESDTPTYFSLAQPAANTLTLSLDFEEGTMPVMDQSDYGHQVIAGGTPEHIMNAAEGSYGLRFDGETDYLQINSQVIGDTDEYSFEMWVNVEDFQEAQVPDGNWQFWATKPEACLDCADQATFSVLTGLSEVRNKKIYSRFLVEYPGGMRANIEVPLDTVLNEDTWYHVLLEHRKAPRGDSLDYYALFQVRNESDEILATNYAGYIGRPLNNSSLPLRLGLAAGKSTDDGAGFQGVMDGVKFYNYATGKIAPPVAPSISEVGFDAVGDPSTPGFLVLSATVTPGLGSPVTDVSVFTGNGVDFEQHTMTLGDDGIYSVGTSPVLGEVTYFYFAAMNADSLESLDPPEARAEKPRFWDIGFYLPERQLVALDFEGEMTTDKSGVGHFVNVFGDPTFTQGAVGDHALELDGVDDYLQLQGIFLGTSDEFALEIRFNVDDFREGTPEGNWMYLVNKPILCDFCWSEEAFSLLWGLNDNAEKKLAARFWNPQFGGNLHLEVELGASMQTETWYHAILEVKFNAAGPEPYVAVLQLRGESVDVLAQNEVMMPFNPVQDFVSLFPLYIGHTRNRGFVDGRIDHFAFYNYPHFELSATSVEGPNELPTSYSLSQNYPNPFNPVTTIEFELPKAQHVTIEVFDMLGRKVATLVDQMQSAGTQRVQFNADSHSSGLYIYRIRAGDYVATKHMMLVK